MRAKDMKVGVLYAYRPGGQAKAKPIPVVVLHADLVVLSLRGHHLNAESRAFRKARSSASLRPRTGYYDDSHIGYIAATNHSPLSMSKPAAEPAEPEDLLEVPVADIARMPAAQVHAEVPDHPGVFAFAADPRYIAGECEPVWESYLADRELADDMKAVEDQRRADLLATQAAAVARLNDLNLPGNDLVAERDRHLSAISFDEKKATTVTLSVAQVEALLGLVPDGVTVPPRYDPDVWEYPEGEGRRA